MPKSSLVGSMEHTRPIGSHLMTNFMKGRKVWQYVSTKIEKPSDPIAEEEWESDTGKINSQLNTSADPTIY